MNVAVQHRFYTFAGYSFFAGYDYFCCAQTAVSHTDCL